MRQIEEEQFLQQDILYFKHLQSGMNRYYWDVLEGRSESYLKLLKSIYELKEESKLYVDFFYNQLDAMAKKKLRDMLLPNEKIILQRLLQKHNSSNSVFYECDERWIEFFLQLSYREILFQTFYFSNPQITVWTNYKGKFIVFTKSQEDRELLREKIEEAGLSLDENY